MDAVAAMETGDPGNGDAVVEAHHQIEVTAHTAAAAFDDADEMSGLDAHEVDQRDLAGRGLETGFQDHAVAAIVAGDLERALGGDAPMPVFAPPQ